MHQALNGVSVPRPSSVQIYQLGVSKSTTSGPVFPRIHGGKSVYPAPWLDRPRIADALIRAARRMDRPLRRDQLVAAAKLRRTMLPVNTVEDVLEELSAAGRLICEWRFIWGGRGGRVAYYSAPREVQP